MWSWIHLLNDMFCVLCTTHVISIPLLCPLTWLSILQVLFAQLNIISRFLNVTLLFWTLPTHLCLSSLMWYSNGLPTGEYHSPPHCSKVSSWHYPNSDGNLILTFLGCHTDMYTFFSSFSFLPLFLPPSLHLSFFHSFLWQQLRLF